MQGPGVIGNQQVQVADDRGQLPQVGAASQSEDICPLVLQALANLIHPDIMGVPQ
jgi:hypothetical protein